MRKQHCSGVNIPSPAGIPRHNHIQTKLIWEIARGILTPACRTPPCPRAGLSPSTKLTPECVQGRGLSDFERRACAL